MLGINTKYFIVKLLKWLWRLILNAGFAVSPEVPACCGVECNTQREGSIILWVHWILLTYFCLHRFCVAIKKENYPDYMPSNIFSDSAKQIFRQPGHTIYLLPTVVICNLLPCELEFYVKGMPISGTLKPGKEAALHTADTSQNIELGKWFFR